jgi:hypothetical protein
MTVAKEEFVCYLPSGRFFWKLDGARWVRAGVRAAIGEEGLRWVIVNQGVRTREELVQALGQEPLGFKSAGLKRRSGGGGGQ